MIQTKFTVDKSVMKKWTFFIQFTELQDFAYIVIRFFQFSSFDKSDRNSETDLECDKNCQFPNLQKN